jgi:hypothetical protein
MAVLVADQQAVGGASVDRLWDDDAALLDEKAGRTQRDPRDVRSLTRAFVFGDPRTEEFIPVYGTRYRFKPGLAIVSWAWSWRKGAAQGTADVPSRTPWVLDEVVQASSVIYMARKPTRLTLGPGGVKVSVNDAPFCASHLQYIVFGSSGTSIAPWRSGWVTSLTARPFRTNGGISGAAIPLSMYCPHDELSDDEVFGDDLPMRAGLSLARGSRCAQAGIFRCDADEGGAAGGAGAAVGCAAKPPAAKRARKTGLLASCNNGLMTSFGIQDNRQSGSRIPDASQAVGRLPSVRRRPALTMEHRSRCAHHAPATAPAPARQHAPAMAGTRAQGYPHIINSSVMAMAVAAAAPSAAPAVPQGVTPSTVAAIVANIVGEIQEREQRHREEYMRRRQQEQAERHRDRAAAVSAIASLVAGASPAAPTNSANAAVPATIAASPFAGPLPGTTALIALGTNPWMEQTTDHDAFGIDVDDMAPRPEPGAEPAREPLIANQSAAQHRSIFSGCLSPSFGSSARPIIRVAAPSPIAAAQAAPSPMAAAQAALSPMVAVQAAPSPMVAVQAAPSPMAPAQAAPSPMAPAQAAPSPMVAVQAAPSPMAPAQAAPSPMPPTPMGEQQCDAVLELLMAPTYETSYWLSPLPPTPTFGAASPQAEIAAATPLPAQAEIAAATPLPAQAAIAEDTTPQVAVQPPSAPATPSPRQLTQPPSAPATPPPRQLTHQPTTFASAPPPPAGPTMPQELRAILPSITALFLEHNISYHVVIGGTRGDTVGLGTGKVGIVIQTG